MSFAGSYPALDLGSLIVSGQPFSNLGATRDASGR
jgi:hypothetical protein